MLIETKEDIQKVYHEHGNFYINGDVVDGYLPEELEEELDKGSNIQWFNSCQPNLEGVAKEIIEKYIIGRWEPKFILTKKSGMNTAEFTVVGDASINEIVEGCLFNLSTLLELEPMEASTRFRNISLEILDTLHFDMTLSAEDIKNNTPEQRVEILNTSLRKKIADYQKGDDTLLCKTFVEKLCNPKPVKQADKVITKVILDTWAVGIGIGEESHKPMLYFGTLDYMNIPTLTYVLGITHEEAVQRVNQAIYACSKLLDLETEEKLNSLLFKYRIQTPTEDDALHGFSEEVARRIQAYNAKGSKTKPTFQNVFINEILRKPTPQEYEGTPNENMPSLANTIVSGFYPKAIGTRKGPI